MSSLYFDHNATTAMTPEVMNAVIETMQTQHGNPSSNHHFGRQSHELIQIARKKIADNIQADIDEIFFTSGGSEANNWIVQGCAKAYPDASFFYNVSDHPCVTKPFEQLKANGFKVTEIHNNKDGTLKFDWLDKLDSDGFNFISIMLCNNENGIIHDIKSVVEKLRNYKTIFHVDAVQGLGKIEINFTDMGVDAMTISAHKIHGPQGIGALVLKNNIEIEPLILGGGQEYGLRSGTENLAAIIGFAEAVTFSKKNILDHQDRYQKMTATLEAKVEELGGIAFCKNQMRLKNTSYFAFADIDGATLITALDKHGIAVASGSACSSNNKEPSHVLRAMSVSDDLAQGAIRISFGLDNDEDDLHFLCEKLEQEINRLRQYAAVI